METGRIIVGITGASGALYAQRLIRLLLARDVEIHLVVSQLGKRLLQDELDHAGVDAPALAGRDAVNGRVPGLIVYNPQDVGAVIASGSFRNDGMAVVPCSANTLAAVAQGTGSNLVHRAAHVCLKERRRLVLLHREAPLSLVEIRNMERATEAGAVVCPANPGFYMRPQTMEELIDFVVGRVMDQLGVGHDLPVRWEDRRSPGVPQERSS